MKNYAVGPFYQQPVRWCDTWQDATDTAQFMADEYLIPYVAWSRKSMDPTERGNHHMQTTCYPQTRRRARRAR
jgi:hypothetical protein